MRQLHLLWFFCLASLLPVHGERSEEWLPVTPQDLQMTAVPGDPDASAVQLYYADFRDDKHQSEFIYKRIKILKESGEKYANVAIEIPQHCVMDGLQARTIHPDNTIVEFKGKPFEKIVARYQREKAVAETFTFPGVTVGSLVEFKYRLLWNQYFNDPTWIVQHQLYTVQEDFSLHRYTGAMVTRHVADQTRLSYVTVNLPSGVLPRDNGSGVELHVENVPAFQPEPSMPPEANFRAEVKFFYGGREIESPEIFWREVGGERYEKVEHFIGNHEELRIVAGQIIAGETDPEKRLRRLYARAQQTRNLSFAKERTGMEDRPSEFKPNQNVMDVLRRGYGSQNEIAELFAGLARAAGFSARVLWASDRRDSLFDPKLLSQNQLDTEIVQVKLNDSALFLDPGTRFCPFGLVAWTSTSAPALLLARNGGSFEVVPTATADGSVIRRDVKVALNGDGSLRGKVTLEFKGNEALDRRLEALNTDDAGRKRLLEAELQSWLPPRSLVQLENAEGWESSDQPLVAQFSVEIDGFAAAADNRLAIPASLFRPQEAEVFSSDERKYPVYFPYTHEIIDRVSVNIPTGYRLETVPDGQDVKSRATRFITTRSVEGQQLLLTRALVVNSIYFQPEEYELLKGFFNKLRAADEEQVVLRTGGSQAKAIPELLYPRGRQNPLK